jgi:hypothetical protein
VDWIAGCTVGTLVVSLQGLLSKLFQIPQGLILVMGIANIAYACGSFTLAMRRTGDHVPYFRVLAVANMLWALFCVAMALFWWNQASVYGIAQFLSEAAFVGGLGFWEWRVATSKSVTTKNVTL